MRTTIKSQIAEIIRSKGRIRPVDIAQIIGISSQMVHRHLKALVSEQIIQKLGTPPLTFYEIKSDNPECDR